MNESTIAALRRVVLAAALPMLAACAGPQWTQLPELYEAALEGAQEVPPVQTAGRGLARVEVDAGGLLQWQVSFEALSGPVTAAHVHGPAGPGQNAAVLIPLEIPPGTTSHKGQARITPEQMTQLASGQWYVNLHTQRHPGGEIRGQLRPRR